MWTGVDGGVDGRWRGAILGVDGRVWAREWMEHGGKGSETGHAGVDKGVDGARLGVERCGRDWTGVWMEHEGSRYGR